MADCAVRCRVGTAVLVAALLGVIGLWWNPPGTAQAVAGEWMRAFPLNDHITRVAVDATGMYTIGRPDHETGQLERLVASRYALDGTPSWRVETANLREAGATAVASHEGTVYTAYLHRPTGAPLDGPRNILVQQFNSSGIIMWSRDLPGGDAAGRIDVQEIVADASGVYLLGVANPSGVNATSALTKLSFLNGDLLWTRYTGLDYVSGNGALAIHNGQIYILAREADANGFYVARFDTDGNETWQPPLPISFAQIANGGPSLSVASSGVYVTGEAVAQIGVSHYFRVNRFDMNKQLLWQRDFLPAADETGSGRLLAEATGFLLPWQRAVTPQGQNELLFRKYDPDGIVIGEGTFHPGFYQSPADTRVFGGAVYMTARYNVDSQPVDIKVVARVIPTTGLTGKVTWSDAYPDKVGQGVQGAIVKVGNQTFTTNAQGEYEVTSDLVGQDATITLPIFEHGNAQAMVDDAGTLVFGKAPLEAAAAGTSNISLTINEQIKLTIDPNTGKLKTAATFGKNVQFKGFGQSFNLTNLRLSDQGVQTVGGTAQLAFKYDANSPPISLNITLNYVKASDELTITGVAGSTFQWGGQTATLSKFEIKSSPAVNTATIEGSIALKLSNVPITATLKGTGTAQGVVLTAVGTAIVQGITLTFDPITVENGQFRVKGRVKLPNQPVELAFDTTTGLAAPRLILPLPQFKWDGQTLPLRLELLGNAMILAGEGNVQIGGQAVALKVDTQFSALSAQSATVRVEAVIPLPEGGEATAKLEYNPALPQNSSVTGTLKVFLALCPGQKTDFNVDVRASAASIKLGFRTQIPVDCDGNGASTLVDINGDFDGQLAQLRVSWPVTVGNSNGRVSATVKSDGTFFQIMFNVELKFGPGGLGSSSTQAQPRQTGAGTLRPNASAAAASDVRILLTDGVGRRTGFDPASGQIVNEIPGGSWTGLVNGMDTFTMPGRVGGYTVTLFSQTQQQATLAMTVGGQTKAFTAAVGPNVPTTLAAETVPQDGGVVIGIGPAAVGCAPRPQVRIVPAPGTPGALQATFSAAPGSSVATNAIREIRIGQIANGVVDADGRTGLGAGSVITFPSPVTSVTLTVRRVTPGQSTTAPLTIVDGCGEWQTFVGGGAGAF